MPRIRIPLVGSLTNRNVNAALADTKDQQFVNGIPEVVKNPLTGQAKVWLNKRQGLAALADVSSGATGQYGAVVWTSGSGSVPAPVFSYLSSGGDIQFFNAHTAGQVGADVTGVDECLHMEETSISNTGNLTAMLVDDTSGAVEAWFIPDGGAWTQITDGDFPATITPAHAHMDGFMFVMTEAGRIYNSDVNSLSAWTATSFLSANSFGDKGVGLARYRDMIVGFGDGSAEFFRNTGNASGSVLSRLENATLRVGAIRNTQSRGTAIRSLMDTVYWIGINSDTGSRGIYRLNGMEEEKISNSAIDKLVANGVIRSIVGSFSLLGMSHVAFSSGSTSVWCYCVESKFWWVLTPAGSLTIAAMLGTVDSSSYSKSFLSTVSNAKLYVFNPNSPVWQDNSVAYTMTVQTDNIDAESDRMKFWKRLRIVCDRESSGSIGVSWSDDDFQNYTTAVNVDITNGQSWLTRLGASRRRSFKFTHSANTSCRIEAVEIDYEMGSH